VTVIAAARDWLGAGTVTAALMTAIVGFLMYLEKRSNDGTTAKVGMIAASQASMMAALQESDADKAELRVTVKEQADRIRQQDIEIAGLRHEVDDLRREVRGLHG
jgi:hypothetical protein